MKERGQNPFAMDNIPSSMTGPSGRKPSLLQLSVGGLLMVAGGIMLPTASLMGAGGLLLIVGLIVVISAVKRVSKEPPNQA